MNHFNVAAGILCDCEGRILISERLGGGPFHGLWEFPGGKVDPGESPEQALCREMREELDVEVRVSGIYEVVFYRYEWGPVLILAYQCDLLTDTLRDLGVAEHRWVLPREMVNFNILPADQPIIDRLNT